MSDDLPIPQRVSQHLASETIARLHAAAILTHPGERGHAREHAISRYVRSLIPEGFGIGTGFVIDTQGAQSRQQDLVVYRRDYHPRFEVGAATIYPNEAVAAVIEVKSQLDQRELRGALENSASVKIQDRTGGDNNYLVLGGSGGLRGGSVNPDVHEHQVFSVIVAANAISPATLIPVLQLHLSRTPRRAWPNMIVVAGSWSLVYSHQDTVYGIRSNQMDATGLQLTKATHPENVEPLVDMAEQLWSFLRVAPTIDVQPRHYVRGSYEVAATYPLTLGNEELEAHN